VVGGTAVETLRSAVESAGATVAVGTSSSWSPHIRDWLRSAR
jgi:hypothetical protein